MARQRRDVESAIALASEAVMRAPLAGLWTPALKAIAEATGAWACNLGSMAPERGLLICQSAGLSQDLITEFADREGFRPEVNLRAAVLYGGRALKVYTDQDIPDQARWRECGYYRDFCKRIDAPFAAFAKIGGRPQSPTFISIFRSERQGPLDEDSRRAFEILLPRIRDAVELQAEFERRALGVAAASLDSLVAPAFFCDCELAVASMSQAAERAVADGRYIRIRGNRLRPANQAVREKLEENIRLSCRISSISPTVRTMDLPSQDGSSVCTVSIIPAPRGTAGLQLSALALILLLDSQAKTRSPLQNRGLTEAETDVALSLLEGRTPSEIADARGSSVATVQTQIKAMHNKLLVRHRAELIAALRKIVDGSGD